MKNAIDWMSRASLGKPAPAPGHSSQDRGDDGRPRGGMSGTMRAQTQLRGNLHSLQVDIMHDRACSSPTVGLVVQPRLRSLNDEQSKKALADFLAAFVKWIERFKR
jgi:NAD(P)H-dependent FMN reductase